MHWFKKMDSLKSSSKRRPAFHKEDFNKVKGVMCHRASQHVFAHRFMCYITHTLYVDIYGYTERLYMENYIEVNLVAL